MCSRWSQTSVNDGRMDGSSDQQACIRSYLWVCRARNEKNGWVSMTLYQYYASSAMGVLFLWTEPQQQLCNERQHGKRETYHRQRNERMSGQQRENTNLIKQWQQDKLLKMNSKIIFNSFAEVSDLHYHHLEVTINPLSPSCVFQSRFLVSTIVSCSSDDCIPHETPNTTNNQTACLFASSVEVIA